MKTISIFWFRRDLRLDDNTALSKALSSGKVVLPIFIFDKEILDQLDNKSDKRVDYIHQALQEINEELKKYKSSLKTYFGKPSDVFKKIIKEYTVEAVFCNKDYEPQAIKRDDEISKILSESSVKFYDFKDQVIFEKEEVLKNDNTPYTVYTPYSRKWKENFNKFKFEKNDGDFSNFYKSKHEEIISLKEIGFEKTDIKFKKPVLDKKIIDSYDQYRDFPAMDHTTRLGIALRFGTISVRECVKFATDHNQTWLNELIWREFFMQILFHFPHVVTTSFKEQYDAIEWRNDEKEFKLWCEGKTGYPIVDAGMRQLNETGFMHNRVRMVVASFLTKHLLIDWRWGETYFAEKLLDYELSSNNGNWQWAAGCGCDAAPYFRIFSPEAQTQKFDKQGKYIDSWLPEDYFERPMVDHKAARERALKTYKKALS